MPGFLAYLRSLQDFAQRNPIVVGATVGLVIIVGVLFSLLPSRPIEDVRLQREMSDTQNQAIKPEVLGEVGTAEPRPMATGRSAARQSGPATAEPHRSKPTAARSEKPDGRPVVSNKTPGGGFTVQVASFVSENAARQLVAQLKTSGYPAFFKAAEVAGKGRTYRVRVGAFANRDEAKRYGDRLVAKEKTVNSVLATIND